MHIVLAPSLQLDSTLKGTAARQTCNTVGEAVSQYCPAPCLDHLFAQAKGLDAKAQHLRHRLWTRIAWFVRPPGSFGFRPQPGDALAGRGLPPGCRSSRSNFGQPTHQSCRRRSHQHCSYGSRPGRNPSEQAERWPRRRNRGVSTPPPARRSTVTPDHPDPSKVIKGDIGRLLELAHDHSGISKLTSIVMENASHLPAQLAH